MRKFKRDREAVEIVLAVYLWAIFVAIAGAELVLQVTR